MACRHEYWAALMALTLVACGGPGDTGTAGMGGAGGGGNAGDGGSGPPTSLEILNGYRARMDLPATTRNEPLENAARAHVDYYLTNLGDPACEAPSPHDEIANCPDFTGENVLDRAVTAGFTGFAVGECIHFVNDPQQSIYDWLVSVYHRFCIASPDVIEIGYAAGAAIDVLDVSYGSSDPQDIARWPVPDADDVERSWDGYENPTPPPPPGGYPSGPIIGIIFGPEDTAHITSAILTSATGDIPSTFLSPDNDYYLTGSNGYFLYADEPLLELREYTVVFNGTRDGDTYSDGWSFFVPCDGTSAVGPRACDDNTLKSCDRSTVVDFDCASDTCLQYSSGARCVTPPITTCDEPDGAFVRCDDSRIIICEGGYELVDEDCINGICVDGPYGPTCAAEPLTTCASQTEQRLRCEGEYMVVCRDGYIQYKSCDALYCHVNTDGTSAYCGAAVPSCTGPRCAGLVPVQCLDGTEVASAICDAATSTCEISLGQAACAP